MSYFSLQTLVFTRHLSYNVDCMATDFAGWVTRRRENAGIGQAELARRLGVALGGHPGDYSRDKVWALEQGTPKHPPADLVMAVCTALGAPLVEGLEAMGYRLNLPGEARVHPAALQAVAAVPYEMQPQLAQVIPGIVAMAAALKVTPIIDSDSTGVLQDGHPKQEARSESAVNRTAAEWRNLPARTDVGRLRLPERTE